MIACNVGLFIGMFRIAISITQEAQRILNSINDEANANVDANQSNELKILLFEYIDAHAQSKILVKLMSIKPAPFIYFQSG